MVSQSRVCRVIGSSAICRCAAVTLFAATHALVLHDVPCSGFTGVGTGDVRITPSGEVNATCQIRS